MSARGSEKSSSQLRREIVDLIAETRSRAVRVALRATLIHRPDPDAAPTRRGQTDDLAVLIETVHQIERAHVLLSSGKDPLEVFPEDLCQWLCGFVEEQPDILTQLALMVRESRRVAEAVEIGGAILGETLRAHDEARRGGFMDALTKFCDRVWGAIDQERERELARAREAQETVHVALGRTASIARHVRLVAINAAIEANRLGDDGRGIAFIANEFKDLAEELQSIAMDAQTSLSIGKDKKRKIVAKDKTPAAQGVEMR